MSKNCLGAGRLLIWASVIVLPIGTFFQITSPQYHKFERAVEAEITARNPDAETGPAMFAGRILAVPMMISFGFIIGGLFTAGPIVIRWLASKWRDLAMLATGAFGFGCVLGSLLGLIQAGSSFSWGFPLLGIGYLLSAAGLALGAIGMVGPYLTGLSKKPRSAESDPLEFDDPSFE